MGIYKGSNDRPLWNTTCDWIWGAINIYILNGTTEVKVKLAKVSHPVDQVSSEDPSEPDFISRFILNFLQTRVFWKVLFSPAWAEENEIEGSHCRPFK